jgi:hypothetical protein
VGGGLQLREIQEDKSNGCVDFRWCDKFNEWIGKYGLLEIKLSGRSFTWSNNQENALMSHIDRVFCSIDFDAKFPFSGVKALTRNLSDHVPLLWEAGLDQPKKRFRFKFEKWWLRHKDFEKLVGSVWNSLVVGERAIDRWQNRVRCFRRKAKGWSANIEAETIRKKRGLEEEYKRLDELSAERPMNKNERDRMTEVANELNKI